MEPNEKQKLYLEIERKRWIGLIEKSAAQSILIGKADLNHGQSSTGFRYFMRINL